MTPLEVKRLAEAHDQPTLDQAADALTDQGAATVEVAGDDAGEQLTHLMLASRVRQRMSGEGEDLRTAWRAVMRIVRGVVSNNPSE